MMQPVYRPYTEDRLRRHFADVRLNGLCNPTGEKHLKYYKNSLENYNTREDRGSGVGSCFLPFNDSEGAVVLCFFAFVFQ